MARASQLPRRTSGAARRLDRRVLTWPQPLGLEHALTVLRSLAADVRREPVVFEAQARAGRVTYSVTGLGQSSVRRLQGHVPDLRVGPVDRSDRAAVQRAARLHLQHPRRPLDAGDPVVSVRTMLAALVSLAPQHDVMVQVVLGRGRSPFTVPAEVADPWQGLLSRASRGQGTAAPNVRRRIQLRADEHLLRADVRFATSASGHEAENVIRGLLAASRIIERDGPRLKLSGVPLDDVASARPPRRFPLALTVSEVLVLLGWPVGSDSLPGQPAAHPKLVTPSEVSSERPFARLSGVEPEARVGIPASEAKFHLHALGPTGSGKSTVLVNLAVADCRAGQSVLLVDPKADTARALLERIPPHRLDDVVVLDPAAVEPVPFNPLDARGRDPYVVADSVVDILAQVFAPVGPRTLDVLNSSCLTLVLTGGTLVDLPDLLLDAGFRRARVAQLDDEALLGFWARYEQYSPNQMADVVGPTMTRLRRVLLRPGLRKMLGAADGFSLGEVFERPTIVIVPTNRGIAGPQAASLLGSLVIATLWNHVLAQADKPESARRPVSVYVDEIQDHLRLPGSDLADALAQSRSLNTRWILANQFLGQLPREMREAIEVNARNRVAFAVTASDAKVLAADSAQLEAADFKALDTFEIYARLTRGGTPQPWFSARTLPLPPVTSDPIEVLNRGRKRWERAHAAPTPKAPLSDDVIDSASAPDVRPAPPVGRKPRSPR